MDEKVSSPDKKILQNRNESSPILDKKEEDTLHSKFSKLIWVVKNRRPVIEPEISFL